MEELENLEKQIEKDSTKIIVRLENLFNKIATLKLKKFVEEVFYTFLEHSILIFI